MTGRRWLYLFVMAFWLAVPPASAATADQCAHELPCEWTIHLAYAHPYGWGGLARLLASLDEPQALGRERGGPERPPSRQESEPPGPKAPLP